MFKLIFNELYKIFHKKSIYLVWGLVFVFCLLNNVLFKITYNDDGIYLDNTEEDLTMAISNLEEELLTVKGLNYIDVKTNLQLLKLKDMYDVNSFQYNMVDTYFKDVIYNINYYEYIETDIELRLEHEKIYNIYLQRFNNNDNVSFIEEELLEIQKQLELISNFQLELQEEILKLRLLYNIDYSNTYLNRALNDYYYATLELTNYQKDNLTFKEQKSYNTLIEVQTISRYIIDNKVNLNKNNDLRGGLKTILEDYQLFIIIVILLVSSSVISDEYSKKTIKLLLVRPYSRIQILLSKYIATIIVLFISVIFLILSELWVGGVIFGFDSLKIPIVVYDFNINGLKEYNVLIYMLMRIGYNLPKFLMLLTISFAISCFFYSSILATLFSFSLYIFRDSLLNFFSKYQLSKYSLLANWDFLPYINGNILTVFPLSIMETAMIYFLHFLLIFLALFVIFKKRDIKNI